MKKKFVKDTKGTIDFKKWDLSASEELSGLFHGALNEIVELACQYELNLFFSHPGTKSQPITLFVEVPLGASDAAGPQWEVDVLSLLKEEISLLDGGNTDDDNAVLRAWRAEFVKLTSAIDARLKKNQG
jgi:hypothetical protein